MERYTRLFSLPENLYTEGSPVLIAAGALLKDNETQRVLVQLKFKSLVELKIKAVKVSVTPFDTVGNPLGETIEYQYLDLSIRREEEFGQKKPLYLPNETTRSFSAQVTQVIFEDNTIWDSAGAWDSLPEQNPLSSVLPRELLEQYHLNFGIANCFVPDQIADLWRCGCGAVNHRGEALCHRCQSDFSKLTDGLDRSILTEQREKRLAEEAQRQAEEKARKQEKAKQFKKIAVPVSCVAAIVVVCTLVVTKVVVPAVQQNADYKAAVVFYEQGKYDEAITAFLELGDYKDAPELAQKATYDKGVALYEQEQYAEAVAVFQELGDYQDASELSEGAKERLQEAKKLELKAARLEVQKRSSLVASGTNHTVGLKSDGTVVAVGAAKFYDDGQCDVSGWKDIVAVSAGYSHTVGLKSNGTVVAVGSNGYGQCNVSDWKDIVAVSAGNWYTVGLKSDGTVVAVEMNLSGECDVSGWKDIVAVSAGEAHTVGLKSDGTVVAVGLNNDGQCDMSGWKDIVAVSAGSLHTVGLKSDGTVVAVGNNQCGQCDVSDWKDIVAVSAGFCHTVGLKSDGTVVAAGAAGYYDDGQCDVSGWKDIVAVSAGRSHTVGLKSDGTVVAVGDNDDGQCNVSGWSGLKVPY